MTNQLLKNTCTSSRDDRSHRREFLRGAGVTAGALTILGTFPFKELIAEDEQPRPLPPPGKADSCIFLWLGGGACHIDTWDPKAKGDPATKKAGSYYDSISTAVSGVQVCQHLPRMANLLDRTVLVRTVHHDVVDEHAAAVNRLHTGRPTAGTTIYPSIGSVVTQQLGARGAGVPAYVVMGYPSASRGPGFLGAKHGYVYLTDTAAGPAGLKRPEDVSQDRQARRDRLLGVLRDQYQERRADQPAVRDYLAVSRESDKLAGATFMEVFNLRSEADSLRASYGGEFGQRCLLARRLVESGVRFVEVSFNLNFINGTGWDTHNEGQQQQHVLIEQLDHALAALIEDLERRGRLDQTLIVVATEFGRPPEFDGGGGRGHYSKAFSLVLAGGGLRNGQVIGRTDELGKTILERPVSVPDVHATIYHAMGISPEELLYDGDRPVPITDHGIPIPELFA